MGLVDFIMARGQSAHPRAVGDACFLSDTHAGGIIAALIADTFDCGYSGRNGSHNWRSCR